MKYAIIFFYFFLFTVPVFSQFELNRHDCVSEITQTSNHPPYKTPNTVDYGATIDEDVIRVVVIFVQFARESHNTGSTIWPANSEEQPGPTFGDELLATERKGTGQTDWWNFYDPDTESLSSWFCEVSKGKLHVIGDVYTVTLDHDYEYYQDENREKEGELNKEIFDYLNDVLEVDWTPYDKWGYLNNDFFYHANGDSLIDMVFRIGRYNYGDIFTYDYSGWANLGYIDGFGLEYYLDDGKIVSGRSPGQYSGSGLTVMGNSTSGILDKNGTMARLAHEFGHWLFGDGHSNYGRMGGGGEYFLDPWERIKLGYLTSGDIETFSTSDEYKNITLYDYSSRVSAVKSLLKIDLPDGSNFLIANRRRVSRWDIASSGDSILGNPFISIDPENYGYGKGIYIHHNNKDWSEDAYPNLEIDIECSDGLWNWQTSGFQAPNWSQTQDYLPVMKKVGLVRTANDQGLPGIIYYPNGTAYYKDGLNVVAEENGFHCEDNNGNPIRCVLPKYFSPGEEGYPGTDKQHTNYITTWTSIEVAGDRYDAWKEGEIFSPYSSPSSLGWWSSNPNVFVWISDVDEQNNTANIKIFRPGDGLTLGQILEATPPSKPMNLKAECDDNNFKIKLTWDHNIEPDMLDQEQGTKRYKIYKASTLNMSLIPSSYTLLDVVDVDANDPPVYLDETVVGSCAVISDEGDPPIEFPVRYKIKAVDIHSYESVFSDFADTVGYRWESGPPGGGDEEDRPGQGSDVPTVFDLKQNFPNPFNPSTNIQFDLPKDVFVSIKVYDIAGREMAVLINDFKNAGRYIVAFNGSHLASGIYYYKIKAGTFEATKRMVLIK